MTKNKLIGKISMKKIFLLLIIFVLPISAQSWKVIGDMPHPVYGGQAIVHDSLIYIIGGFSYKDNTSINLIQQYNPAQNSWKVIGHMNTARYGFVAGQYLDSLVICGGAMGMMNESSIETWNYNSSPFLYDNQANCGRTFSTGLVIGENLYMFGGLSMHNSPYSFIYNIAGKKITYTNDSIFKSLHPIKQTSTYLDGKIFIFGGISLNNFLLKSVFMFDITNNTFIQLSSELPKPRAGAAAVTFDSTRAYIIGGFNETQSTLSSVDVFKKHEEGYESEEGPRLNYARKELMAVKFKNSIYVFGGENSSGEAVKQIERLNLVTAVIQVNTQIPNTFELEQNYPNPFNPTTQITFKIAKLSNVSLDVYSILGQHIKNLVKGELNSGKYSYTWDGTNIYGAEVASGVYIYRLTTDNFSSSKKMELLR